MWIEHPLRLSGKTVTLLPLESSHFDELIALAQDEKIWTYMPLDGTNPEDLKEALHEALTLRDSGEQYPFVVIENATNRIIGSTRYLNIDVTNRKLEVGWTWYAQEYWGKGYNDECKLLLFGHCFQVLKAVRAQISAAEENVRSRKAIEKVGARFEGVFRSFIIRYNGMRNVAYYSIIDDEWADVKVALEQMVGGR